MALSKLYNLAKVETATTGTSDLALGDAVAGFLTFAEAGVEDGDTVSYGIVDGDQREVGQGVFDSSGPTLTRATIYRSTGAGNTAKITLSGTAEVHICQAAEDMPANLAGQLPRTGDDDDAADGRLGQYISGSLATGSATILTSGAAKTVAFIDLPPGDWDVRATLILKQNASGGTPTFAFMYGALSTADNANTPVADDAIVGVGWNDNASGVPALKGIGTMPLPMGPTRVTVPAGGGDVRIYLVTLCVFMLNGGTSVSAYGKLSARSPR